jgi:glutamyl endopeptidase
MPNISSHKIPKYKSVGNETVSEFENTITNGIPSQGIPLTSDLDAIAKIKVNNYRPNIGNDSINYFGYKHISTLYPNIVVVINGPDDRTEAISTEFPYKTICQLLIKDKYNKNYFGTGFFISERCIITAGHCVFIDKDWAKEIKVIPGAIGTYAPYGSSTSNRFRSVEGWTKDDDRNFDHGAIILSDNNLYNEVNSYFGYKPLEEKTFIEISGYPIDKDGIQYKCDGMVGKLTPYRIYYDLDTLKGNSGSPVFIKNENNKLVVGVHSFGDFPNYSIRVNQEIINRWSEWSKL